MLIFTSKFINQREASIVFGLSEKRLADWRDRGLLDGTFQDEDEGILYYYELLSERLKSICEERGRALQAKREIEMSALA